MYTIYHIEGVKIGCSVNPKRRVKDQGYSAFQVLEVHDDIKVASERERELQIEYGYGRDSNALYHQSANMCKFNTFEGRSKAGKIGGKIGGKKAVDSGQLASIRTFESCSKGGKTAIKKVNSIERTCPYCSKTMNCGTYGRWHGQKCKLAPATT